jgi:hypothetical protein
MHGTLSTFILCCAILLSCDSPDSDKIFIEGKYNGKRFADLLDFACPRYIRVSLCILYANAYNMGVSSVDYEDIGDGTSRIIYHDSALFGLVTGTRRQIVPLRCEIEPRLKQLVDKINNEGHVIRFIDAAFGSILGIKKIQCD